MLVLLLLARCNVEREETTTTCNITHTCAYPCIYIYARACTCVRHYNAARSAVWCCWSRICVMSVGRSFTLYSRCRYLYTCECAHCPLLKSSSLLRGDTRFNCVTMLRPLLLSPRRGRGGRERVSIGMYVYNACVCDVVYICAEKEGTKIKR